MRNNQIDILKGIAIILMVLGHCGFPFTNYIYLFHMSVFFIAGGFCFKQKYSENTHLFLTYLQRKLKTIYFPFVLWNTIFLLCNNMFVYLHIYSSSSSLPPHDIFSSVIKGFTFRSGTTMGGAFWFLIVYFYITIFYGTINYIIYKLNLQKHCFLIQYVISMFFLFLGYHFGENGILLKQYMGRVLSFYILFHIGVLLKNIDIKPHNSTRILTMITSFFMLLFCKNMGKIALNINQYQNPFFLLICSLLGWLLLYNISFFLAKSKHISYLFILIGQNTLPIMILHFLSFKFGNFIIALLQHKPLWTIEYFPVLDSNYWYFYTIIGVSIPVCLNLLRKKIPLVFRQRD